MSRRLLGALSVGTILVLGLVLSIDTQAVLYAQDDEESYPPVTVPQTEVRTISSSICAQDYAIWVALPMSYDNSDDAYPVLYMLDPLTSFGIVTDVVRTGAWGGELPELIIVSIGYPPNISESAMLGMHTFDLVVAPELFLQFINEELIPFIDTTYRTDPTDRGIVGHSDGGAFVLHALMHSSDTFNRFLAGSATFPLPSAMQEFVEERTELPAKLYVSIGGIEGGSRSRDRLDSFVKILQDANLEGLEVTSQVFEGETHFSSHPLHLASGIYAVYRKH